MYEELIIAGFGGQGVLVAGKLLAQTAMVQGRQVTYMPSYGPEVRGGTANCMVVMADEEIACPLVSHADSLIIMNEASLQKFSGLLKTGGLLVINSSIIKDRPARSDVEVAAVPADEISAKLGSPRSANMVVVGAYLQRRGIMTPDAAAECLGMILAKRHHDTIAANRQAILAGADFVAGR